MPSLKDAFKAYPVHIHQNRHLDFTSLKELPDSHKWTHMTDDLHLSTLLDRPFSDENVPVVDLSDPNASEQISHACKTWGVFQVINHGIPIDLLEGIESVSSSLFSLPIQEKLKAARSPDGISGFGLARISSFFSKLMWSEGFTIVGSPLDHFRLLWPRDYNQFCDIVEDYQKEMQKLAGKLMWLMLGPLGITNEDIKWAETIDDFNEPRASLQLNYYPACPDPNQAMGLAAHTDSTLLTILYQNSTSGLQVSKEGTRWLTVPPIPGGLVINVGDLLHILSNGLYPSVLHRAVVNRTKHRFSFASLHGPPTSVQISPLQKLVGPNQPPLYRPVTWNEFLGAKSKYFDRALSSIRVSAPLNGVNGQVDENEHKIVQDE